jgi:hypothetical protein
MSSSEALKCLKVEPKKIERSINHKRNEKIPSLVGGLGSFQRFENTMGRHIIAAINNTAAKDCSKLLMKRP